MFSENELKIIEITLFNSKTNFTNILRYSENEDQKKDVRRHISEIEEIVKKVHFMEKNNSDFSKVKDISETEKEDNYSLFWDLLFAIYEELGKDFIKKVRFVIANIEPLKALLEEGL